MAWLREAVDRRGRRCLCWKKAWGRHWRAR
jgi:uncharacterized BrkB/YihY/UPF0761 family membrane protein